MTLGIILLILIVLLLVGSLPAWPYSRGWDYMPSSLVGGVVVLLIVLLLMGRL
ncbi:MAG: DUF3309 domain-containing protein [Pseudomonadota bacterium]|nr:DUF3309 domain-containing protein [Pseudomonadota bacterium]